MDNKEDLIQTNGSKTLLIRRLPAELSQDEKEDLLKYFGAESVRVLSNTGRLVGWAFTCWKSFELPSFLSRFSVTSPQKHTAFASFRSEKSAAKVSCIRCFCKCMTLSESLACLNLELKVIQTSLHLHGVQSPSHLFQALSRLHQLKVLDHTLVAEFAKGQDHVTVLKDPPVSDRWVAWMMWIKTHCWSAQAVVIRKVGLKWNLNMLWCLQHVVLEWNWLSVNVFSSLS